MKTILGQIFEVKRSRVDAAKRGVDLERLAVMARDLRQKGTSHRFRRALDSQERINVIAEFKRASPSKGVINDGVDPSAIARAYRSGGAAAISVLTEEDFFKGSLDDLLAVREEVSLPILRKDFIFDDFQVYESALAGADAILLIVGGLNADDLGRLRSLAENDLGMDALVEVHTSQEMRVALDSGAKLIGVNNRNLKTFEVSLDVSRQLGEIAPQDVTLISESGLGSHRDIAELARLGYRGFLIGETLMRSDDPQASLRRLMRNEEVIRDANYEIT